MQSRVTRGKGGGETAGSMESRKKARNNEDQWEEGRTFQAMPHWPNQASSPNIVIINSSGDSSTVSVTPPRFNHFLKALSMSTWGLGGTSDMNYSKHHVTLAWIGSVMFIHSGMLLLKEKIWQLFWETKLMAKKYHRNCT